MQTWLTSANRKRHQRELNKLIRRFNKNLNEDELWQGRFQVWQVDSPVWMMHEDQTANLLVRLRFVDRATGACYDRRMSVNHWRHFGGSHVWNLMNWLITEHWDVWEEDLARERRMDEWKEYNRTTRVV